MGRYPWPWAATKLDLEGAWPWMVLMIKDMSRVLGLDMWTQKKNIIDDKEKKYVSVENHRFQELDGRGICGLHSIEGNKPDSFWILGCWFNISLLGSCLILDIEKEVVIGVIFLWDLKPFRLCIYEDFFMSLAIFW